MPFINKTTDEIMDDMQFAYANGFTNWEYHIMDLDDDEVEELRKRLEEKRPRETNQRFWEFLEEPFGRYSFGDKT